MSQSILTCDIQKLTAEHFAQQIKIIGSSELRALPLFNIMCAEKFPLVSMGG